MHGTVKRRVAMAVAGAVLAAGALVGTTPAFAGGGCHGGETLTDQRGVLVDLKDFCFVPNVLRVQPGQTVTWRNDDAVAHTVTGVANSWGDVNELGAGQSATYRFQASGVYPYACLLHPGMVGAVVVGDGTSSKTTTQDVVPVVPPASIAPQASAPVRTQPANPVPAATHEASGLWRLAVVLGFLVLVTVAGVIALRMLGRRRAAVRA
jgi:plastocyanin